MGTKICSKCKSKKDKNEFHKKKSSKDGLSSWCKICAIENAKQIYRTKNLKLKLVDSSKNKRQEILDQIDKIKTSYSCFNCGENEPCCLDFHHLDPSIKNDSVSSWARKKSVKKVIEEINKCIVVCSNCHRKIHHGKLKVGNIQTCNISNLYKGV